MNVQSKNKFSYENLQMCKIIDAFPAGADIVDKAFAATSLYYNYTGDKKCFNVEGGDDPHGLRGWGWQVKKKT
jgi:lysosomal Pro-X carboxypeptidase